MDRVDIKELFAHPESYYDKTVTVAGWARTVRDSKAFGFVELNDGGCFRNLLVQRGSRSQGNTCEVVDKLYVDLLVATIYSHARL